MSVKVLSGGLGGEMLAAGGMVKANMENGLLRRNPEEV